jgi:hypothetical protein
MKRTDLPFEFQQLLSRMPYVAVATTCPGGEPWNTPVVGYFDDELNLYWSSDTRSQHSKNIRHNASLFTVVYDTTWPLGTGAALYLQMRARKLTRPAEVAAAKQIYLDRYGEAGHEPFMGSCPRRIYCAKPLRIWKNTDGVRAAHFVDIRRELLP